MLTYLVIITFMCSFCEPEDILFGEPKSVSVMHFKSMNRCVQVINEMVGGREYPEYYTITSGYTDVSETTYIRKATASYQNNYLSTTHICREEL
jgi:hypothetical protein